MEGKIASSASRLASIARCCSNVTYLSQKAMQQLDEELMSDSVGYSIDMLMELAGQAIAHSVHAANCGYHDAKLKNVLVVCGPGNNGGDGIVAARHLSGYSEPCQYSPSILLLRRPPVSSFFDKQLKICTRYGINVSDLISTAPEGQQPNVDSVTEYLNSFDVIIDALFGFSFKPPVRAPSDVILDAFKRTTAVVFSVDIPSGWDVEKGNVDNSFFQPSYLISLTLPKTGVREFKGKHFIGGRFVPHEVAAKHNLTLPIYEDNETFVEMK